MRGFLLRKTVRSATPRVPFEKIAHAILPKDYELSLVLVGDALGRELNQVHTGRTHPTNVLSFPLSSSSGEIFINVRRAERDAQAFNHTVRQHIAYLFIHGCLHLSGLDHGATMERKEREYLALI